MTVTTYGLMEVTRGDIVFTAQAQEAISAGWLVHADMTTVDTVNSTGLASLAKGDIKVWACNDNSGSFCAGIALQDMGASGSYGAIATRGLFILRTAGAITYNNARVKGSIAAGGENFVTTITVGTDDALKIGTCLTGTSASGSYAVVLLNV